jgi:hypothetical protein
MIRTPGIQEPWHPHSKLECDAVLVELETILVSSHFCNSKRYPAFLRYVVENSLAGRADQLKERTLGIEVFDRPPTFDTNSDTVVRYTAGEVRKRLQLYYAELGHPTAIRISLPAGSYIPEFNQELPEAADYTAGQAHGVHGGEAADGAETEAHWVDISHPSSHHESGLWMAALQQTWKQRRNALLVSAGLLLFMAGFCTWRLTIPSPQTVVERFWAPVLHDQKSVLLCTGSVVFADNDYSGVITANKDIDYSFVSLQNASAIAQISSTLARSGMPMQMAAAPSTTLHDLTGHSIVLVGGYNNQWTMHLVEPLRFHFSPSAMNQIVLDRQHPEVQRMRDRSLPYSGADDYALVVRFRSPATDSWIVAAAGVGRNGTEAAAQFISSPHYLQQLQDRVGSAFDNRNLEAVLKVSVVEGKSGAPTLIDAYAW